tara:strand:- start:3655 stop:5355 length:1701 start_codon:yes stop_codon:yes gene_type:complete
MKIDAIRHSLAHVLAMAVKQHHPNVKLGIGPAIDDGFYYDFDNLTIEEKELKRIEKTMRIIIGQALTFKKREVTRAEAKKLLQDEPYKLELLSELKGKITFYTSGDFEDLCAGPHVKSTKDIKAFKLTKIAGSYWKGDSKNKMLTRIYGLAFSTEQELIDHQKQLMEAEKRNHIKLGKKLDLFSIQPEGPGFVFLHPKGMIIWNELLKLWNEEHKKERYDIIKTPVLLNKSLWETSGHWSHYKEKMYTSVIDEEEYGIKPMNCPGGMLFYKTQLHSYREFPLKVGEIGLVHRHELSGTLNGLFRVRSFHQDDAHVFCVDEKQAIQEVKSIIKLVGRIYKVFGLSYELELSTRPEKRIGDDKVWDMAEDALKKALEQSKREYKINAGDGAFYGPKIDFHIKDAIGRTWQCATIQFDFSLPERFELTYEDQNSNKQQPIMLHRVIYGAVERFLGILIEHFAGAFPVWLAPVQVAIVPVSDAHLDYAKDVKEQLVAQGVRVHIDDRSESVGKKVREQIIAKIPYILTLGDKEIKAKTLAIRTRDEKVRFKVKLTTFLKELDEMIKGRKL